jgi:hypothetical protein
MMIALVCTALATEEVAPLPQPRVRLPLAERFSTHAYRATIAAGSASVGTRLAFVEDFDGPFIVEGTLRAQAAWHVFGVAVEVAGTGATSANWSSAGLGNTVLDLRILFGRGSTHAIGLRGTFPFGTERELLGPISWWGTVPTATVPTTGVALAYEGATRRWVWHVHAGSHTDPLWAYAFNGTELLDLGVLVGTVQPLGNSWSLVAETEVVTGHSPWHLRALARKDLGAGWTIDAGLAAPVLAMIQDPTLQILARAERSW